MYPETINIVLLESLPCSARSHYHNHCYRGAADGHQLRSFFKASSFSCLQDAGKSAHASGDSGNIN